MNRTFKLLVFLVIVLLVFSCKKRYGCASPKAINYDPKATAYDGSCWFEFEGAVSWGQKAIDSCLLKGVEFVNIYHGKNLLIQNQSILADYGPKPKSGDTTCAPTNWPKYKFRLNSFQYEESSYSQGGIYSFIHIKDLDDSLLFSSKAGQSIYPGCTAISF